jgi:hypothetical protein
MRASRETELVAEFPTHVMCEWLGNSETVARRHYLTVRDEDYDRAVLKSAAKSGAVTHSTGFIGGQNATELSTIASKNDAMQPMKPMDIDDNNTKYPRRDSNPRPAD